MSSRGSSEITLTVALAVLEAWSFDDLDAARIRGLLNGVQYPGDTLEVKTRNVEIRRVPWRDHHPLNRPETHEGFLRELFGLAPEYGPDQDMAERLREKGWDDGGDMLLLAAADLIDNLRAEVASLRAEVDRLRAEQP